MDLKSPSRVNLGRLTERGQRNQVNEQSSVGSEGNRSLRCYDRGDPFGPKRFGALLCVGSKGEQHAKLLNVRLVSAARVSNVKAVMSARAHAVWRVPAPWDPDNERHAATAEFDGQYANTDESRLTPSRTSDPSLFISASRSTPGNPVSLVGTPFLASMPMTRWATS
jgi:hypothetical protein